MRVLECLDQAVFVADLASLLDGIVLGPGLVSTPWAHRAAYWLFSRLDLLIGSVVLEGNL